MLIVLLALQACHVAFLWLHDWVPLGRLNDVVAVRSNDTLRRLILTTLIQSAPYTVGVIFSARDLGQPYPDWLHQWLWISYAILFIGELRAWWLPYFFRPDARRAARYQRLFANTHSFLPARNGIAPNTLYTMLHLSTFTTLVLLALVDSTT